jgi:hypothetical protein
MKTTATTKAVSSPPEENEHWSQQWRRNTTCGGQKPRADWKNVLQIRGAGRNTKTTRAGRGHETIWEMSVHTEVLGFESNPFAWFAVKNFSTWFGNRCMTADSWLKNPASNQRVVLSALIHG